MRLCWKKRPKRSVIVILLCGATYIVLFNIIALYSLFKSSKYPASWIHKHGQLYLGHFAYNNWTCKPLGFSYSPLPVTALASFPGSGSTWIRHILQEATGIATGSTHIDASLKKQGFPGEGWTNSSVIIIKTHDFGVQERAKYDKTVILLRDPFDAILSGFNSRHGGRKGHAQTFHFQRYWETYVRLQSKQWYNTYHDWIQFKGPAHVMVYSNIRSQALSEVQQLLDFLQVSISQKELLCAMKNFDGNFKRPSRGSAKKADIFTKSMTYSINEYKNRIELELEYYLNKSNIRIS